VWPDSDILSSGPVHSNCPDGPEYYFNRNIPESDAIPSDWQARMGPTHLHNFFKCTIDDFFIFFNGRMGPNIISVGIPPSRMLFHPIGRPEWVRPMPHNFLNGTIDDLIHFYIFQWSDGPEYHFSWNIPESDAIPSDLHARMGPIYPE
jgi:hypothetical protein